MALIQLEPKAARALLREWAPRLSRPHARFVTLFMREHSVSLAPRAWIELTEGPCDERRAQALFDGVRNADTEAPRTLLAYLDAADARWSGRAPAVRFFIDALIRLGAPAKVFACRKELDDPCRMTSKERGEEIEKARSACLSAARAWLRANSGHTATSQSD